MPDENIGIVYDPTTGEFDIAADVPTLHTAVIASLFFNRDAGPDSDVPADQVRQGYWMDSIRADGDILGSELWQLERGLATDDMARRAEGWAQTALAWMVADKVASKTEASAAWGSGDDGTATLMLRVVVVAPDGAREELGPWAVLRGG